jgi:hypothetical protein
MLPELAGKALAEESANLSCAAVYFGLLSFIRHADMRGEAPWPRVYKSFRSSESKA